MGKLNYKRTVLVGFAFFLICAFWQAYDAVIPLILTNKFGMSQDWSGLIMALDNILAVFLLPLFGALSDKRNAKSGKRTPFITFGTILAAILLLALTFADYLQLQNITAVSSVDNPAGLVTIYDAKSETSLKTPDGTEYVLGEQFTQEEFSQITCKIPDPENPGKDMTNPEYTDYVVPARQSYVADITAANPGVLILFVGILLLLLIAMAVFRSPAVALMPDVVVKPLRSKANAVINLMGTAGGIVILLMGILFKTSAVENSLMTYFGYFGVLFGLMLVCLFVFRLTVKENLWAQQMRQDSIRLGIEEETPVGADRSLSKGEKRSLILILLSIALWYFGYNAVTSKYSVYAANVLDKDYNTTMLLAQVAAVIAYLPAGMAASKIGRRKTILIGVALLAVSFGAAAFMRPDSPDLLMNLMFVLAGIAWATINVNSFPMVVELCTGGDIGKYTGYYYTASMIAQSLTPYLSGLFLEHVAMTTLFPYATIFVALSFVTMFFVKHGDVKVAAKKGLEALDVED